MVTGTVTTRNVGGAIFTNSSGVVVSATAVGVPNAGVRYYEITLSTNVSSISVTSIGDFTAGGAYDPGIYLGSAAYSLFPFKFTLIFLRSSPPDDAGFTTFVDTFSIQI